MANAIRKDSNIKGFQFNNRSVKISQMEDDTTKMIRNADSIDYLFTLVSDFQKCSGLKANEEKTKAFNISNKPIKNRPKVKLKWETGPINLLGLSITDILEEHVEVNIQPKIVAIKKLLDIWKQKTLSLKGKITIINSLVIPKIIYPQLT